MHQLASQAAAVCQKDSPTVAFGPKYVPTAAVHHAAVTLAAAAPPADLYKFLQPADEHSVPAAAAAAVGAVGLRLSRQQFSWTLLLHVALLAAGDNLGVVSVLERQLQPQ